MADGTSESKSPFTMMGALSALASGLTVSSVMGLIFNPDNPIWKIMLISVLVMAAALGAYKLLLSMKDKSKSKPFMKLLTRSGSGGTIDPATKARMDDLRQKFEEGVRVYESAGKNLYTLPWFLLVGPSGSGKTEAMRNSSVQFPSGLQDCLQGTGGTLNMHWWFTNQAVVLDTAGRLFMQEDDREWKEFLGLLKSSRGNCPINGLLLVISSENLLKDSAEKIAATAGAIARKLDEMQRILDVRFPVTVVVTKCDKIIGFREFCETIRDPVLQHQMLGWSNPASLDEAFKPDMVDQHLNTVRQKLLKRRMGLLQNPVHTEDPSARRIDQVDELFELPDNLVRISPRLRLYLEKIFVAGEWSPKPLFLRGIYFTSSMREGQALDMSLAQALGVEVESLPGGRDWEHGKAFFLKDLFVEKVFREQGLVTRATNVSKALARQRLIVAGIVAGMLTLAVGVGAVSFVSYQNSLGVPTTFWTKVSAMMKDVGDSSSLAFVGKDGKYQGRTKISSANAPSDASTAIELIKATAENTSRVKVPLIAKPLASVTEGAGGFEPAQIAAHRAIFERNVLRPVVDGARAKLAAEKEWGPQAVAALAELIRLQTYSYGVIPSDLSRRADISKPAEKRAALDLDALYQYVLSADADGLKAWTEDKPVIDGAFARAYPDGADGAYWVKNPPEQEWARDETLESRVAAMAGALFNFKASPDSSLGRLQVLADQLTELSVAEDALVDTKFISDATAASVPAELAQYNEFKAAWVERFKKLDEQHGKVKATLVALGQFSSDPIKLAKEAGDELESRTNKAFRDLLDQLPEALAPESKAPPQPEAIVKLRQRVTGTGTEQDPGLQKQVVAEVAKSRAALKAALDKVAPLLVMGAGVDQKPVMAVAARVETYAGANGFVNEAEAAGPEGFRSMTDRAKAVADRKAAATTAVNVHGTWQPVAASLASMGLAEKAADVKTGFERAGRAATRAVELARMRFEHEQFRQFIDSCPARLEDVVAHVKDRAEQGNRSGSMKPRTLPELPFSVLKGGMVPGEYHPDAAAAWLADWSSVTRRLRDKAEGGPVLGLQTLRGPGFAKVNGATEAYVGAYCDYWRAMVIESALPTELTGEWSARVASLPANRGEIEVKLKELRTLTLGSNDERGALKSVPEEMQGIPEYKAASEGISKALAGLEDPGFGERSRVTLTAWRGLTGVPAATAAQTLLDSFRRKKGCEEYYAVSIGPGTAYWDELVYRLTDSLSAASAGDVGLALQKLREARKSPLFLSSGGSGAAGALSTQELAGLKQSAELVSQAASAGKTDNSIDFGCAKDRVRARLEDMTGQASVKTAEKEWAKNVADLCTLFAGKDVRVTYSTNLSMLTPPGDTIRSKWNYFQVNTPEKEGPHLLIGPENVTPQLLTARELRPGTTYTIRFSNDQGGGKRAWGPEIPLNVTWPLLHEMLMSGEAKADGEWIEFPIKQNGTFWIRMQVIADKTVVTLDKWPKADKWP